MTPFHILGALSAVAMAATVAAGVSFLMRPEPARAGLRAGSGAVPAAAGAEADLSGAFGAFRSTLSEAGSATDSMAGAWTSFDRSLREFDPSSPAVKSEKDARDALVKASRTVEAMAEDSAKASQEVSTRVRAAVAAEIDARAADLAALKPKAAEPWAQKLEKAVFFGRDLPNHLKGIDLVWIDDPQGFPESGGFWAGKKEVTFTTWSAQAGGAPANSWTPPKRREAGEFRAQAVQQWAASLSGPAKRAYDAASPANREALTRYPQNAGSISRIAQSLAAQNNTNIPSAEGFPASLVNLPSKEAAAPFLQKLPSGQAWGYRLPRKAEWALLEGKVEGIRKRDLSEWLDDQPQPVDSNWKSENPTSPPAAGTVGFRVVYVPR